MLEAASVAGVQFATVAVAAALEEDPIRVEEVCTRLARRAQLVRAEGPARWPDGTVTQQCAFIHGLYQAITYEQIGVGRRTQWHQRIGERLETHYRDVQDLEFTIERGRLYMLQTRNAKRTGKAAVRAAVEMVAEGLIDSDTALLRVEGQQLDQLLHKMIDPSAAVTEIPVGEAPVSDPSRSCAAQPTDASTPATPKHRPFIAATLSTPRQRGNENRRAAALVGCILCRST